MVNEDQVAEEEIKSRGVRAKQGRKRWAATSLKIQRAGSCSSSSFNTHQLHYWSTGAGRPPTTERWVALPPCTCRSLWAWCALRDPTGHCPASGPGRWCPSRAGSSERCRFQQHKTCEAESESRTRLWWKKKQKKQCFPLNVGFSVRYATLQPSLSHHCKEISVCVTQWDTWELQRHCKLRISGNIPWNFTLPAASTRARLLYSFSCSVQRSNVQLTCSSTSGNAALSMWRVCFYFGLF